MIKLLLVDDERIIRDGISAMLPLKELGIRLTSSCANAFDALDSMADDMPDILLTDVKMPNMDGLALIERAQKLNPALRCIVLSGYDEFAFAKRALQMGVREYLLKPCMEEEMTEVLQRLCLEIRQARRQASLCQNDRATCVADIAQRLVQIVPDGSSGIIEAQQVQAVLAPGEEVLLREAYTHLIAHHMQQSNQVMVAIQQAYRENADWTQVVAQGLAEVYAQADQRHDFVKLMCHYVQQHYQDEELSLQYLADHVVHMQAGYIGKVFAQDTGRKISRYILEVRMEKAKELLAASPGETRIYEVAEAVGLGHNPQYFSALFRKYTGLNPKQYGG